MKKIALLIFILLGVLSCKQESKSTSINEETNEIVSKAYPEAVSKIFDAHGGITAWNEFKGLSYEIEKPEVNEKHTVALKSRKSIINGYKK